MAYLHALHSSAIAWEWGNVTVRLSGDWESCGRLEAGKWCNHAGLCRRGGGGHSSRWEHGWSHDCFLSFFLLQLALALFFLLQRWSAKMYPTQLPIYNDMIPYISSNRPDSMDFISNRYLPLDPLPDDITVYRPQKAWKFWFLALSSLLTTTLLPRGSRSNIILSNRLLQWLYGNGWWWCAPFCFSN